MRLAQTLYRVLTSGLSGLALLSGLGGVAGAAHAASEASHSAQSFKYWQPPGENERELYRDEPLPPGIQVIVAPFEGPVFADARGRTLYTWPLRALRNGATGDREGGKSSCTDEVLKTSAGLMSPYPAGLLLPDLDTRPSCAQVWPPLIAPQDAREVGKWTIIPRDDGTPQWAYDSYPVYTSVLDEQPGDVRGGSKIESSGDGGVVRTPIGPAPAVPPEFLVLQSTSGRVLVTKDRYSIYAWEGDGHNVSNCNRDCLASWTPVRAPQVVTERDDWTIVKPAPGVNQWAFRGRPLYTYNYDRDLQSFRGADVAGWSNVYTQRTEAPPEGFTVQDVEAGGEVLADARGHTIYLYNCRDDSFAQLACDNPDSTQAYRLAICGGGDAQRCRENFPYVEAAAGAKATGRLWSIMAIDPDTGRRAQPGQAAMNVWAYRGRPVYTYSGDDRPGVTNADGYGEFTGRRNGFKAFMFRDIFQSNEFRRF